MSAITQLQIDGGEVPYDVAVAQSHGVGPTARAIMRLVRDRGYITPIEAGMIVHAGRPGHLNQCHWCSSDGSTKLRELAKKGLIRHRRRGVWVAIDEERRF